MAHLRLSILLVAFFLASLASSSEGGEKGAEAGETNVQLANANRLKERHVKAVNYQVMHCEDQECRSACGTIDHPKATCPFNMAGFESWEGDRFQKDVIGDNPLDNQNSIIQTLASTIGSPAFAVAYTSNVSAYRFSPVHPGSQNEDASFWTSVQDRYVNKVDKKPFPEYGGTSQFPHAALRFTEDDHTESRHVVAMGMQIDRIVEFEDVDNDGHYEPGEGGDKKIQELLLDHLKWKQVGG